MRVAKETHKFLIGGVCAESAKKMKFFFSPYLTEEYPIWWGIEPRIIDTFMESYNFDNKTMIPFCTSGSSGIGNSVENLKKMAQGAVWKDGKRFPSNATADEIKTWVEALKLR